VKEDFIISEAALLYVPFLSLCVPYCVTSFTLQRSCQLFPSAARVCVCVCVVGGLISPLPVQLCRTIIMRCVQHSEGLTGKYEAYLRVKLKF
jgi:hypothetical protein